MTRKERFEMTVKIVERAENMGIGIGDRITRIMDIEFADKEFHLRLDEFLNADEENFCHDFCGIQAHMDRKACKMSDLFVPRFAGYGEG